MADEVSVLVEGGKAAAGAQLGSALGPLGVNVGQVVAQINQETKQFAGMRVPVVVKVNPSNRTFTLVVGRPPVAAMLLKEAKKEKGSGKPKTETVGDVSLDAVKRIAEAKGEDMHGRSVEEKINQVIGTCVSLGLTVGGEDPRALLKTRVAARDGP
ncbi:MAG TPA: 50S ribosomal protein L11 [Thermoplasmata archaeon]|nr:50S ribosomal protein L11 [Thermoplasmata archaeon]